jgi:ankyrin repeat protein
MATIRPNDPAKNPAKTQPGRTQSKDVNAVNEQGMSPLHIAIGQNDIRWVRSLIEQGAKFFPDKEGRWPSTIAALMEVDDELQDYIADEEEKAEQNQSDES